MRRKSIFDAGISSKFSSLYKTPYQDTTLDAATAAKQRAERKLKLQEQAIQRQQEKIQHEVSDPTL
ncbi:unnamed protein product [Aphanomyces euteiches]